MRTRAIRKGDSYEINGRKGFITNGSIADTLSLFTYTDPGKRSEGITAFVVEKGSPGLTYGKNEDKMGMRGSINSEFCLEGLLVPLENRIGEEGEGAGNMMAALDTSRLFSASQAVGLSQGAIDEAVRYIDRGKKGLISKFSAMAKFLASDTAMKVTTDAVQIMGG